MTEYSAKKEEKGENNIKKLITEYSVGIFLFAAFFSISAFVYFTYNSNNNYSGVLASTLGSSSGTLSLVCPLEELEGRKIVSFNGNFIRSDETLDKAQSGPYDFSLNKGKYKVTLVSYDNHSVKPTQVQPDESWFLKLNNNSGDQIAATNAIGDLPDAEEWKTETVNDGLEVSSDISSVLAYHAAYPSPASPFNPNSITPVCAAFDPVAVGIPKCVLNISKEVDKTSANIGDTLTYTLNFSNSGDADCTGGGVEVKDIVADKVTYKSETYSDNVDPGYGGDSVYDSATRILFWNAGTLTPGESGWVKWTGTINNPETCGDFDIANTGKITSWEYAGFTEWVNSNTVNTKFNKACPPVFPTCPLAGDGDVAHYETGLHQIAGNGLLSGKDDVYSLENNNYVQCFCPVEGDKGIQTNWFRTDYEIDGWYFENGKQWNLGDYNYAAQNKDFKCTPPATPTPPPPTLVPSPAIDLTKTANPNSLPVGGGSVSYAYNITNSGNVVLSNITLTDDKCSAVTYSSGDTNTDAKLDLSETWKYSCSTTLTATTTNTATVKGKHENTEVTDTATATVTVATGGGGGGGGGGCSACVIVPRLTVVKIATPAVLPAGGGMAAYDYQVYNPGDKFLTDVILRDDKCAPVTFTGGDTDNDNHLDRGEIWKYKCKTNLVVTTTNTATATGKDGARVLTATAQATVYVPSAELSIKIEKFATPKSLPARGGQTVYTYNVINPGKAPLRDVTVKDDKCDAVKFIGGDINGNNILENNETWQYNCKMQISMDTVNIATARGQFEGRYVTDVASAKVTVGVIPQAPPSTGGGGSANVLGLSWLAFPFMFLASLIIRQKFIKS